MSHLSIILNGPPGCGKDTIAKLMNEYGFHEHSFKRQLYIETARYYGVNEDELVARATVRELKEEVWEATGVSPRNMLIHTSENVIKPRLGKDFFGKAAAQRCQQQSSTLAVFSDGGFAEEIPPLKELYKYVVVVRLHREGFSFGDDSRTYLDGFIGGVDLTLEEGAPEKAVREILWIVDPIMMELKASLHPVNVKDRWYL